MNIETYYLSSVSVAATLFSLLLIAWALISIWLVVRLRKVLDKVDKLTDTTSDMAHSVNELVQTSTQRLISLEKAFLTAQGIKHLAYIIVDMFHNRKDDKKGATHETQ
ncbi:MAG: hypothetical protein ABIT92_01035 [Gammaproteobacteria bacterium]